MTTYTLEAGRSILRDGVPFVTINGTKRPGAEYVPPEDMDAFARAVVPAMNSHAELRETLTLVTAALDGCLQEGGGGHGVLGRARLVVRACSLLERIR